MKSNMKKGLLSFLWVLVVAVQTASLVYTFTCVKKGFFSDEIWSYGLANSYYQPFVILKDNVFIDQINEETDLINLNQWVPGSVYKDYFTVQPGERFAYGSVYHNQTLDHHPPLFYMLLHTVSSFFPNQFSWWYGFSLCIVFFWITQIFLFLSAKELTQSDIAALLACCLYGGSVGMLCTFAFIRQYGLLTMLCTVFMYLALRLFREERTEGNFKKKTLAAAAVTAFLAFSTHYYAIIFIGSYTALYCLYLLLRKRIRQMFLFGGDMLAVLLVFFAVYPAALFQLFNSSTKLAKYYRTATCIRILISQMCYSNFGIRTPYFATAFWNITIPLVIAVIAFGALLLFPFRKEEWCRKILGKLKRLPRTLWGYAKDWNYVPAFALLAGFVIYVTVAETAEILPGNPFLMRYIALTFPVIILAVIGFCFWVLNRIKPIRKWAGLLLAVLVLSVVVFVRSTVQYPFAFEEYGDEREIQDITEGKRILVISDFGANRLINTTCFSLYLSNAEECFLTATDELPWDWQDILTRKGSIDYLLISSYCISLDPAVPVPETMDCAEILKELFDGENYHFVKGFRMQTGEYYLLQVDK